MSQSILKKENLIHSLLEKMKSISIEIEQYVTILKNIKYEDTIFHIELIKKQPLNHDQNMYAYYNIKISFQINELKYSFSFLDDDLKDLNQLKVKNNQIKVILNKISDKIKLESIQNYIYSYFGTYMSFVEIKEELEFQKSDFYKNYSIIHNYFKKLVKQQVFESDEKFKYGYIKIRKNPISKLIHISYKDNFDTSYLQIKFPIFDEVNKLLSSNDSENIISSLSSYDNAFKSELYRLNKDIFDKLNISKNSITIDIKSKKNGFHHDYNYSGFNVSLRITSFNEDSMQILTDKIKLEEQIVNF